MSENTPVTEAGDHSIDCSHWVVRKGRLGDSSLEEEFIATTPEERLAMVWPLTVQAWAFRGLDIAESRLPRHLMRLARRER